MHTQQRHLMALLANAVFCTAIGIATYLLIGHEGVGTHLMIAYAIGFSIHGTVFLGLWLLPARWPPIAAAAISLPPGLLLGLLLGGQIAIGEPLFFLSKEFSALIYGILFGLIGLSIYLLQANLWATRDALAEERAQLALQQATLAQAELKLLQAQIEPHFLFNTLSAIHSAIRHRPDIAQHMLEQLTLLLRANLQRSHTGASTVQDELDIVTAYLNIQHSRLGERLDFSIHADEDIRQTPLPPLLVQPLVENAAVHGIEPTETGGHITVAITRQDTQMKILVEDTGCGMEHAPPSSGTGTGLSNLRQRMRALFGDAGSLRIEPISPQGSRVTLSWPLTP